MFSMHECFPLLIANRNLSFSECLIISLFALSLIHFCSMIENLKSLLACAEPRGGSQDDFESVLKDYYDSIGGGNKPANGRRKMVNRLVFSRSPAIKHAENSNSQGAAFLAVCRGKVCMVLYFKIRKKGPYLNTAEDISTT